MKMMYFGDNIVECYLNVALFVNIMHIGLGVYCYLKT